MDPSIVNRYWLFFQCFSTDVPAEVFCPDHARQQKQILCNNSKPVKAIYAVRLDIEWRQHAWPWIKRVTTILLVWKTFSDAQILPTSFPAALRQLLNSLLSILGTISLLLL